MSERSWLALGFLSWTDGIMLTRMANKRMNRRFGGDMKTIALTLLSGVNIFA